MKLTYRILLLVVFTTSLSTLANSLLMRHQGNVLNSDSEKILAQTVVQSLRDALVQDVINGNKLRVSNLLRTIKEHDNPIEFLYVTGVNHLVFAHSFEKGFPRYLLHQKNSHLEQLGIHLAHKYQTENGLIYEYSEALIPGLETTLHIGINQTHISDVLAENTQYILEISITTTLIALLVAYFWGKRIVRPLTDLAQQIRRFGAGDTVSFTNLKNADPEIHQLSLAFQSAADERHSALAALKDREQNLAITLNSIGDAVITTDAQGIVTRMNPIAEMLTGWKLDEAQGKAVKTIFPIVNATTREPISNPVEKVLATGETVYLTNHTTLIAKDGTEYHIADSAAPIRNRNDHIEGMVLVFNDVTEQYLLREKVRTNQQFMQGLLNDLKSMVGIMQPNCRIAFINSMPLELTELDKDAVVGQLLWECAFFRSDRVVKSQIQAMCSQVVRGETASQDLQFQAKDGSIWMKLGIYPVLDAQGSVFQMVFEGVDISQRKETEALQKNYQLKLEQQVQERTNELEKKAIELARVTKLKTEFLANMSHELRTPMNSIIGFTGRVINKAADKLEPRQLNNLHTVERNAHHLLSLINGLLDLSKIEAGKMEAHAESFGFTSLVHEVFNLTRPMLEDKTVELKTDLLVDDIILHTDSIKLKQILINLISNAIKFTHEGKITVAAELLDAAKTGAESEVIIRIMDTGVGMNEEALKYIFEAFRQIDGSMTRRVGGTGLGLAIVRSFTELLRGTISVESKEGVGTTFEIVIPVNLNGVEAQTEIVHKSLTQPKANFSNKLTILCIDDELEALELVSGYLDDEGYHVVTALSADEGLALAKELTPFAITLDILMPNKDGWSVLSELKADENTRDIPVFIISFMDNKAMGYQLGAFDYMQKPVDRKRLISSIHRLAQGSVETVLVVDDDPEACDFVKQILADINIGCDIVNDGYDALAYLKQTGERLPDLLLLDLMMPGMDGFELLQKIQQNPIWKQIPIIVMTAKNLAEHEREFLKPRVATILSKEGLTSQQVLKQMGAVMHRLKDNELAGA